MKHAENFKAGLIGRRLSHSFSPQIHALLADYDYRLFELEPNEVGDFLKSGSFDALNVTIPYKKTVLPFLSELTQRAEKIGCVNTIIRTENGLRGYNTDYYGFSYLLKRSEISVKNKKVLILGSGGAAATANAVVSDLPAREIVMISRNGENNYSKLDRHLDAEIIINTTPVGMYPNTGEAAISLEKFKRCQGVIDLIYNPLRTKLLCDAERLSIPNFNGLAMLAAQAKLACELFLSAEIDDGETEKIIDTITRKSENIILIGMPGCGKTTAGRALASLLGRKFADTDAMVEERAGMSVRELFERFGEEEFRRLEHEAICACSKESSLVIATGGGAVTNRENHFPLHQNGKIIFLRRDIAALSADGRPLSQKVGVERLYAERLALYLEFCDAQAQCDNDVSITVNNINKAVCGIYRSGNGGKAT